MKKTVLFLLLTSFSVSAAPSADGLYATLQTTMGDICFELFYTDVPQTTANFVSLAEGSWPWIDPRSSFVSTGPYYNGIIFHRVIDGFMIQCGSPKGDGTDGPGYAFQDEFVPALRHNGPGIVSMANSGFDTNGGQIFITVTNTPWLDDVHTVFGQVVEGMQTVYDISQVATNAQSRPLVDVVITNVFITRNGTDAQNFSVMNPGLPEVEALPLSIAVTNGLELTATAAASSYQYVYSSTNLSDWTQVASQYLTEPIGDWKLSGTTGSQNFFHANRVTYTPDTNRTVDVINHQFFITAGSEMFDITLQAPDTGIVSVNGGAQSTIQYWSWSLFPYRAEFIVQVLEGDVFKFDLDYSSPVGPRCRGAQWFGFWFDIGSGTFADVDLGEL